MSNFHGRNAHEIAMGSGLLVAWVGELLVAKGVVTREELAAVAQAAEGTASAISTVSTPGAVAVIQEIARRWEGDNPKS